MASVRAGALLLVLFILLLIPQHSTTTTLYVTPSPHTACPSTLCHLLSQYIDNATEYFLSNTNMIFLPGKHTFNVMANVTNVTDFSMVGGSANTTTIVCSGLRCGGFYFDNVTGLNVTQLSFVSDSHSITTRNVYGFQLVNCTFANSSNTAVITNNSNLHIEGNTFINNTGGTVQQMTFIPGGGIAVFSSNVTLHKQNNFLHLTCVAEICGGGAMYAERSTVYLEGNCTFINNTATSTTNSSFVGGGGGLFFFNTATSITGHLTFLNNSVSIASSLACDCEIGGGGASLTFCNASISGSVFISDNLAKGDCACGGGIYLQNSSVTINRTDTKEGNHDVPKLVLHAVNINPASSTNGNVLLKDNHADYAGGGIYMQNGNLSILGTVKLINNSVGSLDIHYQSYGGGIAIFGGEKSVTGDLLIADSYAGYAGGGIHVQFGNIDISGTVSLINNSANSLVISPSGFGGGISIYTSNMSVTGNLSLRHGYAAYAGGGIEMQSGKMSVSGEVSLTNNSVGSLDDPCSHDTLGSFGGGINMVISDVYITGNFILTSNTAAGGHGGGWNAQWSTVNITGTMSLSNNSANNTGGGIAFDGASMTVSGNVTFINNIVTCFGSAGGGIFLTNSNITIENGLFATNYANEGGGLAAQKSSMIRLTGRVSFIKNSVDSIMVEESFLSKAQ